MGRQSSGFLFQNNLDMVQSERKLLSYPSLSFSPTLHVDAPKSDMKCSEMVMYSMVNRKKIYSGDILLAKLQYWQKKIDNSKNKRIRVVDCTTNSNPDEDSLIKEELIFHKDCGNFYLLCKNWYLQIFIYDFFKLETMEKMMMTLKV